MNPVLRSYDAFVESLDLAELGIVIDENQAGNPKYEPKAMVKLLTYGHSYGIRHCCPDVVVIPAKAGIN